MSYLSEKSIQRFRILQELRSRGDRFLSDQQREEFLVLHSLLYHNSCVNWSCIGYYTEDESETHCPKCDKKIYKSRYVSTGPDLGNEYIYLGDRLAKGSSPYTGQLCRAILNDRQKCIRGKNANMLVSFNGVPVVVLARMLRKVRTCLTIHK